MKEKAFTLIELLAVIVILAVIAIIAVPLVVNIIDKAKDKSAENSIAMAIKTMEDAYALHNLEIDSGLTPTINLPLDEEGNPVKWKEWAYFDYERDNDEITSRDNYNRSILKGDVFSKIVRNHHQFESLYCTLKDGKVCYCGVGINAKTIVYQDGKYTNITNEEQAVLKIVSNLINKIEQDYATHNEEIREGKPLTINLPPNSNKEWSNYTLVSKDNATSSFFTEYVENGTSFEVTSLGADYINQEIIDNFSAITIDVGRDFVIYVTNGKVIAGGLYLQINNRELHCSIEDGKPTIETVV
jgi:prepilin-type N-terminal cleavage/methylation domain-containing protein